MKQTETIKKILSRLMQLLNLVICCLLLGSALFHRADLGMEVVYPIWKGWVICNLLICVIIMGLDWPVLSVFKKVMQTLLILWLAVGLLIAYQFQVYLFQLSVMAGYFVILLILMFLSGTPGKSEKG